MIFRNVQRRNRRTQSRLCILQDGLHASTLGTFIECSLKDCHADLFEVARGSQGYVMRRQPSRGDLRRLYHFYGTTMSMDHLQATNPMYYCGQ